MYAFDGLLHLEFMLRIIRSWLGRLVNVNFSPISIGNCFIIKNLNAQISRKLNKNMHVDF